MRKEQPGPHDGRNEVIGFIHSSDEAGEQRGETLGGAGGAKGWNQGEFGSPKHAPDAESGERVQVADRIRRAIARNPKERLTALLHHINVEALRRAYLGLRNDAAPGIDGVRWEEYGAKLEERLLDLHSRVHRGAYRAPPVRRVNIPKPYGRTRPLGVAALEDKILQKAVVDELLTLIYEAEFLGLSYGFRPGRKAHDALDALALRDRTAESQLDRGRGHSDVFDAIDRDRLMRFVERRIGDWRLLRKWLNAGEMEEGTWSDSGRGTPQGATASPVLANGFLHYVLDQWFHRTWRPRVPGGEAILVRYADDFVAGFQRRADAERFFRDLEERCAEFGLELHPEKTRLVEFGRFATANRRRRGERKPETFDFLGFTHYCAKTRKGRFRLGRKPSAKQDEPDLAPGGGEAVETTARGSLGGGEMAGTGPERLAQLFCGPGEYAMATKLLLSAATAVAASVAPPVSARPLQLETAATDGRAALAVREDSSPVAGATVPLAVSTQGRSRVP